MEAMEAESSLERAMIARARETKTPINGSIELLPLCNMNCGMCYVRLSRQEMERQGRLRGAEEWLALARQMEQAGVLFLLLTGGEPLLYPEFKTLYPALKKLGMILTVNTNGTLIDEDWAAFFGQHKPRRMNVTLYGADDGAYERLCRCPGGFEKALRGIRLLRREGVDVKIGCSVTRQNRQDLERILALGRELDVPVRMDTYMMPGTRERGRPFDEQSRLGPEQAAEARICALKGEMGPELWSQYVNESIRQTEREAPLHSRQVTCMAGNCSFTVYWQGEMRPCVVLSEPSVPVFETGFAEAWRQITEKNGKILLNEKCARCSLRPLCRTCAACALLETGDYQGLPDYMCRYAAQSQRLLYREREEISRGSF